MSIGRWCRIPDAGQLVSTTPPGTRINSRSPVMAKRPSIEAIVPIEGPAIEARPGTPEATERPAHPASLLQVAGNFRTGRCKPAHRHRRSASGGQARGANGAGREQCDLDLRHGESSDYVPHLLKMPGHARRFPRSWDFTPQVQALCDREDSRDVRVCK